MNIVKIKQSLACIRDEKIEQQKKDIDFVLKEYAREGSKHFESCFGNPEYEAEKKNRQKKLQQKLKFIKESYEIQLSVLYDVFTYEEDDEYSDGDQYRDQDYYD